MIRLAADENFDNRIVRSVFRRSPNADFVRVQDSEASGADDPAVLEWAAREGRVVVTHDTHTLIGFAYERLKKGLPMPGVLVVGHNVAIAAAVEDIVLVIESGRPEELSDRILHLPL